jgi:RNA-splicing ligase RtcB
MAEGCLYGVGKGNPDFNFSAPHGAGRLKRRLDMKNELESGVITLDQYKEVMRNSNVWTSSCNSKTIDESPMAYKKLEDIEDALKLTVDVKFQMKAIYNLKA